MYIKATVALVEGNTMLNLCALFADTSLFASTALLCRLPSLNSLFCYRWLVIL